jgi:ribulose-bisphosphate carboxylase small chain
MRVTQGQFSFLPELTNEQIGKQIQYALDHDWPISIEYTDDPHPRNSYWEMYGLPMFDVKDAAGILADVKGAIAEHPDDYVKVNAYDPSLGRQTTAMSFIVHRPASEPGFRLERTGGADRSVTYKIHPFVTDKPSGERYKN